MRKEEKLLYETARKLEGTVLAIGVSDEKLLSILESNEKIVNCQLLNEISKKEKSEGKIKRKRFSLRRLRKKFHKKKVDYILCNIETIEPYLKNFVKDSVYINRGKIYFYGTLRKESSNRFLKRYQKYHAKIEECGSNKSCFTIVSNEKSKSSWWKDISFAFLDACYWFYEMIGDLLIN